MRTYPSGYVREHTTRIVPAMTDRENVGLGAWRAMLLAYDAAMRAIDAELARAEAIPLSWYDVLLELRAAPDGRLRMQELSGRVVLSRTRVSRMVDDMAQAGLVDKVRDGTDRRVVWATITPSGVTALRSTAPLYLSGIERHFSAHLTDEEKRVVATALAKVTAAHTEPLCLPTRRPAGSAPTAPAVPAAPIPPTGPAAPAASGAPAGAGPTALPTDQRKAST